MTAVASRQPLADWRTLALAALTVVSLIAEPVIAHASAPEFLIDEPGTIVGGDVVITGTIACGNGGGFVVAVKDLRQWVDGVLVLHLWGRYTRGECTDHPVAWTAVADHGCGDPVPGLAHLQMTFFLFEHGLGSKHDEQEVTDPSFPLVSFPLQGVAAHHICKDSSA